MTSPVEISVVIPTKDRWSLLSRAALPAAMAQEGVDFEVIVVDDGSTDETPARLTALASQHDRVRALCHDRPLGVSAARNTGLAAARGAWVAFLDDDDVWSPLKLSAQLAAAKHDGTAWVYAGAVAVDETGRLLYEYYFPDPALVALQLRTSAVVPAGASNVIARTHVVRALGGFDEQFQHLEDWDFWIRLSEAERPTEVREVLVAVLFHSSSKHAVHDQAEELAQLIRKHAARTPPLRLTVDRLGHARWVASQHSRAGRHGRAAWLYLRAAVAHRTPTDVARAIDAMLGKRVSRAARSRRPPFERAPVAAPAWLESWPILEHGVRR